MAFLSQIFVTHFCHRQHIEPSFGWLCPIQFYLIVYKRYSSFRFLHFECNKKPKFNLTRMREKGKKLIKVKWMHHTVCQYVITIKKRSQKCFCLAFRILDFSNILQFNKTTQLIKEKIVSSNINQNLIVTKNCVILFWLYFAEELSMVNY